MGFDGFPWDLGNFGAASRSNFSLLTQIWDPGFVPLPLRFQPRILSRFFKEFWPLPPLPIPLKSPGIPTWIFPPFLSFFSSLEFPGNFPLRDLFQVNSMNYSAIAIKGFPIYFLLTPAIPPNIPTSKFPFYSLFIPILSPFSPLFQ